MSSRSNIDQLDGYLLRALCALMEARSVSQTARQMHQTQPAISAALKRLRLLLADPLLVRNKLEMVPTERGLQLAVQARRVLEAMGELMASPKSFVAALASSVFRIASPDYMAPSFMAEVARRIGSEAPQCSLELHPLGPDFDGERALADNRLDIIIGNWPDPPERLHRLLLLEDQLVCLVRKGHPLANDVVLTEALYLSASHVAPMPYSSVQRGVVETHLARLHRERDVRVRVPYFALAPHVVAQTDLMFTTARHFAQAFMDALPLVMLEAPPGFPMMNFYQLWHQRAHHAPAHRWLRGLIVDVGRRHRPSEVQTTSIGALTTRR
jgi:DNA-binding transcriptional LysR family regulator